MRRFVVLGALVALMAVGVVAAPVAQAACHAFEVSVAPANPTEGGTVEVTVTRDAAVNPSSVRLRSVDGSANAGQDYEAVDRIVQFATETEQTVTVRTTQDAVDEPAETFRLELSGGGGCQINPNFRYGAPATITIDDDDQPAPTTTAAAAPTTTSTVAASTTTTTAAATDESTTSTTEPASTTSTSLRATAADDADDGDDGGSGTAWLIVGVLIVAAAGGAAYWVLRARRGRAV